MEMKIKRTQIVKLSPSDIEELITEYLSNQGIISDIVNVDDIAIHHKVKSIPVPSMYPNDCDYDEVFDGFEIIITEE